MGVRRIPETEITGSQAFYLGSVHANKNAPTQQLSTVLASGVSATAQLHAMFVILLQVDLSYTIVNYLGLYLDKNMGRSAHYLLRVQ